MYLKGGVSMQAVNYSNLRTNLKQILDNVTNNFETVIVTRKNNENVVVMSEAEYNNLMENSYIRQNPRNYERLLNSIEQLNNGKSKSRDLKDYE